MTLSTRQIRVIAAFAGLNILLVVVGWIALVGPQRNAAAASAAQVALAQTQLAQAIGGSGTHGTTKQPVIHTSCLYKLNTALPAQEDQASLLLELQQVAEGSGVKVTGVAPQPATAMPGGYTVVPINLQLDGRYYELTAFLHNLRVLVADHHGCPNAKGPLFAVSSVALSPQANGDAPATVQIQAFFYGVTAGAAPPVIATTTDTTTTTGG
jgi:hypothetical protein